MEDDANMTDERPCLVVVECAPMTYVQMTFATMCRHTFQREEE